MGRKTLLAALFCLLCLVSYYYLVKEVYTISNVSLLIGSLVSIAVCSLFDTDFFEKTITMLIIVLGGACLGLGFWLWSITILAFLLLRTLRNPYYYEVSAGYIVAQITVEGGIIVFTSVFMLGLLYIINFIIGNPA